MTTQTITLSMPDLLYQHLKVRAQQAQHSVEDEVIEVLAASLPLGDELPEDLEAAISPLSLLDDEALWRAARNTFPANSAQQLEALHQKRQREGLTADENQTVALLVQQYERAMLVRAQAVALLKERGHDISSLLS